MFRRKKEKIISSLSEPLKDTEDWNGFRLFFLGENEYDVEVSEVKQIDFDNVKRQLLDGKSVFMKSMSRKNYYKPENES